MVPGRIRPRGAHGQRILADRNRDSQRRAQFDADRAHRGVEVRVLARLAAGRHPIRRQADIPEVADIGREDVGDRLGHRQTPRRRGVQQRHGRPLAHRHGLAAVALVTVQTDRDVGHGHLPRTHHLVAADQAADGAVADGDQEGLVGHRRQAQQPVERTGDGRSPRGQAGGDLGGRPHIARHARRLAQ